MVCPHDLSKSRRPEEISFDKGPTLVSEWWIERCLHHKMVTEPSEDVYSRPFDRFPLPGLL